MEYKFNEYVALQSEIDVLAENKEAMALIKTFDGTAKNSRGAFIAKAVSDLKMNSTTAGAYWQRNKKYAIGQDATTLGGHWQKVNQAAASKDGMVRTINDDIHKWGKHGQRGLPQNGVKIGPLNLETPTDARIKASGHFYGVKNSETGNLTGWVVFPTEGYANKIWDNTRPVMKATPLDDKLYAELQKSIPAIGDDLSMTSAGMMKYVNDAHNEFKRNQEADSAVAKNAAATASDPWTKSVVQTYQSWLDAGQKVTKMEGIPYQDSYSSTDGGGYQGRSYRFGIMNAVTYRFVGVSVFPKEGMAFITDGSGKRQLPQRITSAMAKDMTAKVKSLGVALDIFTQTMLTTISGTLLQVEREAVAAKGAVGDIKKFCALADSISKDLIELEKLAAVINPHVKNDALEQTVSYRSSETRKSLTGFKQWANDIK